MKVQTTGGAGAAAGSGQGGAVKDLLDRVHDEFSHLQQQLHSTRMELEKSQQERDNLQRYTLVVSRFF
jgi:hypothetical protein